MMTVIPEFSDEESGLCVWPGLEGLDALSAADDNPHMCEDGAPSLLTRLVASKALTQFQAEFIESLGDNFNADSFAHPYLQTIREHTRAYLAVSAVPGPPR